MMIDGDNNNYISTDRVMDNDNILQIFFEFCDIDDILNLSMVCKKFNKITKRLDYKFEAAIRRNFFSRYYNYE